MRSPEISRREFFTCFTPEDQISISEGIIEIPAPPGYAEFENSGLLLPLASMAGKIRLSRRGLLVGSGLLAGVLITRSERIEADNFIQTERVEVELAIGNQSFPWNPLSKRVDGEIMTGRIPGGAYDKADLIEQLVYGDRARSRRWKPLRQWIAEIADEVVIEEDQYDINGRLIARANWQQAGFCAYAGTASLLAPFIRGPIIIGEIEVSELERKQITTLIFGGILRDPVFNQITPDVVGMVRDVYLPARVPMLGNYTDVPYEDWWGAIVDITPEGNFVITKPMSYKDGDGAVLKIVRRPESLKQIAILNPGQVQPGEEGAAMFIDPIVAGLVKGTLRIVS